MDYFRKKLRKGVIGYVHVNLALALLLGFVIFMFGVELASWNSVRLSGGCIYIKIEFIRKFSMNAIEIFFLVFCRSTSL